MSHFVKIEGNSFLVRDMTSGAIINTNRTEYENYMSRKKLSKDLDTKIKQNSDDIETIKSDITEIKSLLITLINKGQ